jgi:hypothetical protein
MKTWLHKNLFIRLNIHLIRIVFPLVFTFSIHPLLARPCEDPKDTIVINKTQGSNKHKIKLYPNATHEVLFFTANGEENKIYQLFIFDVDGKLVKQAAVRNRQTGFLAKLNKGNYVYEVFSNDERIENGKVVVK